MSDEPHLPELTGRTVLVMEDEFYLAMELTREIRQRGGEVIGPFATIEDGMACLQGTLPDCAVVDINLGEGPSFAIADALCLHAVPFIFLTGYDADVIPPRFSNVVRVEKPVNSFTAIAAILPLAASCQ